MTTAQTILVVYGTIILTYGLLLGVPMAAVRMKEPAAPRALVNAHLSALMQAPIHLALASVIGLVGFDGSWSTLAAVLLVIGTGAETIGGTLNWLTGTTDQFAERSVGFRFNTVSGPPAIAGGVVFMVGVLTHLS